MTDITSDIPTELPPPVRLELEGPQPQRRWTVALRILLAFPHFILLGVLGFFAAVVVFAAWFVALFTGRVPDGMARFIRRVMQYGARVYSYSLLLLTDVYPPFSLETEQYPVGLDVPEGRRLNRLAVLFRFILMIPITIISQLAFGGLSAAMVIVWIIVLVTGRLPTPMWEAASSILQYQMRVYAYVGLLTPRQADGLFGDPEPATAGDAADADAAIDHPADVEPAGGAPRVTRIPVSRTAKRLIALFMVMGLLFNGGAAASNAVSVSQADRAAREVDTAYGRLQAVGTQFESDTNSCALKGGAECLHSADLRLAAAFEAFHQDLGQIDYPGFAIDAAARLRTLCTEAAGVLRQMADTADPDTYTTLAGRFGDIGGRFDDAYADLLSALGSY